MLGRRGSQEREWPLEAEQSREMATPWSLQEGPVTCSTVFSSKPPDFAPVRGGGEGATSAPCSPPGTTSLVSR